MCPRIPLGEFWDSTQEYYIDASLNVATMPIDAIYCPSDQVVDFDQQTNWFGIFRGNYACNAGSVGVQGSRSVDISVLPDRAMGTSLIKNGGQPFVISTADEFEQKSLSDITDGTSSTLAFSECLQGEKGTSNTGIQNVQGLRGAPYHAGFCWFTTWVTPNSSTADINPDSDGCCVPTEMAPCFSATVVGGPATLAARSRHPGGINAAMLDGSVQFIDNEIEWSVWQAMGTSQGEEVVTTP